MKRKKSAISGQEVFNNVGTNHIPLCDSYGGTCVDSNSSADRSANPNSPFVPGAENFCLDSIKSHKSSEPLVWVANTLTFRTTSIFLGSVACLRGLVIYAQCPKTLVSSTDYAFNFHFFSLVGQS